METAIFILAIVAFFVWAGFAHAQEKSYGELRESIDRLYDYISKEKRERDSLYRELGDKNNECLELREKINELYNSKGAAVSSDSSNKNNTQI